MARKVREYIDVADHGSLDRLIERLIEVRDSLPSTAEAEVKMRGDDHFGRRLTVSYFRPQTPEEAESDQRCANAFREARARREAEERDKERHGHLRLVG